MKQAFMVTQIQCGGCGLTAQMPMNVAEFEADIEAIGEEVHAGSQIVCFDKRLMTSYVNLLVDDAIIDKLHEMKADAAKVVTNGGKIH